jgi:hypothetical protein
MRSPRWLKEEVAAAYDEHKANPSDVVDAREVAARVKARHRARADRE